MCFFNIYHGIQGDSPSARRAWQEGWGAPERTRGAIQGKWVLSWPPNVFCHDNQSEDRQQKQASNFGERRLDINHDTIEP